MHKRDNMIASSFDVVFYTCIFILPGFLSYSIIKVICNGSNKSDGVHFISSLGLSIINLMIVYFAFNQLDKKSLDIILQQDISTETFYSWLYFILSLAGTSIVIGTIFGIIKLNDFIRRFLRKIGIIIPLSIPSAWDYCLSKLDSCWVTVHLNDGTEITGTYADNSYSSSDANERDLFLEEQYEYGEDKKWSKCDRTGGIYIAKNQIAYIKFYNNGDEQKCQSKKSLIYPIEQLINRLPFRNQIIQKSVETNPVFNQTKDISPPKL